MVNNSSASSASSGGQGGGRALAQFSANFISGGGNALRSLHATVGYEILLYGFGAAILIAIIGSAIPSYLIAKVRPAEVMRAE